MKINLRIIFATFVALLLLAVSCKPQEIPVASVSLSNSSLEMIEGETAQLTAKVLPDDASNKSIVWKSNNETVASVMNGTVTAVAPGEAVITVEAESKSATCRITVKAATVPVASVGLDKTSYDMLVGDSFTLNAVILPENATDKTVVWSTSDSGVATVTDGLVTAVAAGQAVITVRSSDGDKTASCSLTVTVPVMPVNDLSFEILPDIVGRSAHVMFYDSKGSLVVVGGHVSGFSPTTSAQILSDQGWNSIGTNHTHDMPFSVQLSSDLVVIGGGCSGSGGIGQSNGVDYYDPDTKTFAAGPAMYYRRTECHAVELTDGSIVVSGNWYNDDCMEMYSKDNNTFGFLSNVSQERFNPYLFETSPNKGIVFGRYSSYGRRYDFENIMVDRFDGTNFSPALFAEWMPEAAPQNFRAKDVQIGDFTYLLLGFDHNSNYGLIKLQGEEFSLVETDFPLPSTTPEGSGIVYSCVVVNKSASKAYIVGTSDNLYRYCVTTVDYSPIFSGAKAKVSLSFTDKFSYRVSAECCCITPDGHIAVSGGIYDSNFTPFSNCMILKP